jgi:hypothetical protein
VTPSNQGTTIRPALFFKETCPPCQWMSKLAVALSLGTIRRVPLGSDEARDLYARYPEHDGQLVLIERHHTTFGRLVFAAVPRVIITTWVRLIQHLIAWKRDING